ncbi:trigger factor [Boudabousia marimammalium]|uniref:Trigger factor n=1 Tax=Boudabousia marimammalium TaxID=156892 RepID=A0A1Q5PPG8_9ACTO|nr:trigger factor [Boudabousia marimammalium]OKL49340.1 trigger factor [Boudabousia marimammalium]
MKSTVETLEPTKVKLTVEVPAEELDQPMKAAYKDIASQVNIPGFRRGKVPARIIDQRIGRIQVIEHAINNSLGDFYRQALVEHQIKPLAQPEISVEGIPAATGKFTGKLEFTAEVICVPEFELPELSQLEIEVAPVEVTDEDLVTEQNELRGRFGTLKTVDRAVENGDFVSIDLVARLGDEEIDSMAGVSYELGSGTMIDGIDEALLGLQVDEDATFSAVLPGGEHAGSEGEINVTVRSIKIRELPALDEDFVQMASEFDTVEELNEDLKKQVSDRKRAEQAVAARGKLVEKLIELTEIPLPESLIEEEMATRGEGLDEEQAKELRTDLEKSMRGELLMERLVEETEVEVSQQDLLEFIFSASQQYGIEPTQLLGDQEQIAAMHGELARTKAVAKALASVKVVDADGNAVDMSEFVDSADDADEEPKAEKKPVKKAAAKKAAKSEDGEKKPVKKAAAKKTTKKEEA